MFLTQIVNSPAREESILDLVLASASHIVDNLTVGEPSEKSKSTLVPGAWPPPTECIGRMREWNRLDLLFTSKQIIFCWQAPHPGEIANIVPVHKKVRKDWRENYRQISLASITS